MSPKHRIRQIAFYVLAAICMFAVALWLFGPPQDAFPGWIDEVGPGLVASVAVLILLLSGYVANPPALGEIGRAALLWGALALVLVLAYSYRAELGALFG
jgi:hypothetical protein